jgi:uracil-DNA glycosylase family 4
METPSRNCGLCPRLVSLRRDCRAEEPDWFNAPVPSFGDLDAQLLVVGLAPGRNGANRTGRPFTGDYAGVLLYQTLVRFGFAKGTYAERADDGLKLIDCRITNAVRCLPPENKPTPAEIKTCRPFLLDEIEAMSRLKAIMALGRVAHESVVATFGGKQKHFPFAHGAAHHLRDGLVLFDSYHCSRYNTNTGRLTTEMFENVVGEIRKRLG